MAMESREAANELYQEGFADAANEENTLAEEELSGSDIVGALLKVQESIDRQAEKNEQTAEQQDQQHPALAGGPKSGAKSRHQQRQGGQEEQRQAGPDAAGQND